TFPKPRKSKKYQENLNSLLEKISEKNIFIITYELFKTYGFFDDYPRDWLMKSNVLIEIAKGEFILTEDVEEYLVFIGKLDREKRYYFNMDCIEIKDKSIRELWNKLKDNPPREVKALFVGLREKNAYLLLNTLKKMYSPILYANSNADKKIMDIAYLLGFLEKENIGKKRAVGYVLKNGFAQALKIEGSLDRFKYGWECLGEENRKRLKAVSFNGRELLGKLIETKMSGFDNYNTYLFNTLIKETLIVEDENGKCFINRFLMKELGLSETDNDGGKSGKEDNNSEIGLTIKKNLGPGIAKEIVVEIKKITGINVTSVNVEKAKNQLLGKDISLSWRNLEIASILAAYDIEINEFLLESSLAIIGCNIKAIVDEGLNVSYVCGLLKKDLISSQVKENLSLPFVVSGLDKTNVDILTSPLVPVNFKILNENKLASLYEKDLRILTLSHVEKLVKWLNKRKLQGFYQSHKNIIKSPNTFSSLEKFEKYGLPEPEMRTSQFVSKKNVKDEDIEAFLIANYLNSQRVYQAILNFNREGNSLLGEMSLNRLKSLCRLDRKEFKKIINNYFYNSLFRDEMEAFFDSARGKVFKPLIEGGAANLRKDGGTGINQLEKLAATIKKTGPPIKTLKFFKLVLIKTILAFPRLIVDRKKIFKKLEQVVIFIDSYYTPVFLNKLDEITQNLYIYCVVRLMVKKKMDFVKLVKITTYFKPHFIPIFLDNVNTIAENKDSEEGKTAIDFLKYYYQHILKEKGEIAFDFVTYLLDEYLLEKHLRTNNTVLLFARRGAEPLELIARIIEKNTGKYDLSRIRALYLSTAVMDSQRPEKIRQYLIDNGILNFNEIIVVDTGFHGSIGKGIYVIQIGPGFCVREFDGGDAGQVIEELLNEAADILYKQKESNSEKIKFYSIEDFLAIKNKSFWQDSRVVNIIRKLIYLPSGSICKESITDLFWVLGNNVSEQHREGCDLLAKIVLSDNDNFSQDFKRKATESLLNLTPDNSKGDIHYVDNFEKIIFYLEKVISLNTTEERFKEVAIRFLWILSRDEVDSAVKSLRHLKQTFINIINNSQCLDLVLVSVESLAYSAYVSGTKNSVEAESVIEKIEKIFFPLPEKSLNTKQGLSSSNGKSLQKAFIKLLKYLTA
ncbi:MAG: hypothetical protein KAJ14_08630, partial [Candidatus Omnitrophica bacterium]|nr:hypothetical protein [Candidatus Omnitrophota bacterium]